MVGIAPGPIEGTEGFRKLRDPSSTNDELVSLIPMQRAGFYFFGEYNFEGKTEDIGSTVLFLVSDAASYITGQTVVVDGG